LKIITFNYDRLLEHYLHTPPDKKENLRNFIDNNVFHVYGQTGMLPFQNKNSPFVFAFENNKAQEIKSILSTIQLTFDDRSTRSDSIKKSSVKPLKSTALGYAYDPFNNDTVGLFDKKPLTRVVANAYGDNEKRRIEQVLSNLTYKVVNYKNMEKGNSRFLKHYVLG
jgi:hypothetical protein